MYHGTMYIVGLTGGIGSGKTAVSNYLANLNIDVIDADIIARQVVAPGQDALKHIASHFGNSVIHADGSLNRQALREQVFQDKKQKQWLNELLHPMIRQHILAALSASSTPYTLLVAPLLFENNLDQITDTTVLIDTNKKLQLSRTVERDKVTPQQVEAIIAAQMSREERCKRAEHIIVNDQDLPTLYQNVQALHEKLLVAAENKQRPLSDRRELNHE